jgi:hypothetical protein
MRKTITAVVVVAAVLTAGAVEAKQKTVAGNWTMSIEGLAMRFVLAQKGRVVTGTLDYPHGAPFKLTGAFADGSLTFSGGSDSPGENFSVQIKATGSLEPGGSLAGTINAHFIEMNDAHEVVRTRDQVMMWTAVRRSPE